MKMEGGRQYRMTARAEAAAATGERILDAVTELFWERPTDQIPLAEVAERAGVTVQTVIRRFGGKEGLLAAAADRAMTRIDNERRTPPDEPERAIGILLDHYDALGRGVLRLLAAEESSPVLADITRQGRASHRRWCADAFPAALAGLTGVDRDRRLAQIVAVCDVHTWKLLHLDARLSRRQTHLALLELLAPLLQPGDH